MTKLRHYMLLIISISILSLVLSIISLANENHVGRYQVYTHGGSATYIINTETSRLFLRIESAEKAIYHDLGTIEKPYSIFEALREPKNNQYDQ